MRLEPLQELETQSFRLLLGLVWRFLFTIHRLVAELRLFLFELAARRFLPRYRFARFSDGLRYQVRHSSCLQMSLMGLGCLGLNR